ncbi:tryptophan synthase beta subunit-like PLP-dependent enzyme [Microdochium trichocladiopsis]|uniref:Tryptophan synthase beta subunit-like PLP-dependent enzyme n=1 Tax=Microdochium trichocladiopsis TaxID=1682393 RepID=A0A9P9BKK0_9PEZI|nr:tryptophan synthase beta subunit-like PLP-dependent enzyme [Microdochium trichocladiopsis]KAH7026709.1 tryptophan synthase beta subunit-like PLP-dependent enzyme [Microdochium trichocladiopsis]
MVDLPEPFASIPRAQLLWPHPSPLHLMQHLTEHIHATTSRSSSTRFWVKREDCSSGLGLGGNKIRKLEYIVPEALQLGATTLVTTGGVQSNHMRQVVAVGNSLGMETVLVPQGPLGNVQVSRILGAKMVSQQQPGASMEQVAAKIKAGGGVPYIISPGASAHMYGGLGFARWAFEVIEQEAELGVFFDTIVVPVASGGTVAGMIAGFKAADSGHRPRRIIGIDTYNKPAGELEGKILEIAQRTAGTIGLSADVVTAEDVVLDTRYNTGTHTGWDEKAEAGVRVLGKTEGIVADPIYSGRAMGAILDMAARAELDGSSNVLFVHTGGQAALGAFPKVASVM